MTGPISGDLTFGGKEGGLSRIHRELRFVQLLFDISQALNRSLNLEEMMQPVLTLLFDYFGQVCSSITLMTPDTGEIEVDLTYGFSREDSSRMGNRWAAAIARKVVETGVPAIVASVLKEALIQGKPTAPPSGSCDRRDAVSYISVPICGRNGVIGAVSAGCSLLDGSSLDDDVRLLGTVAPLLAQAIEIRREANERERMLQEENSRLRSEALSHFNPANIVGNSHVIRQVCRLVNQVASSQASVFITGESGAGKELVAEAIHVNSPRAAKQFLTISLAALSEGAIERELFGQSSGIHPGARERKGQLEMADGGTLFLNEVDRLPMSAQVRLLRFLQEKEFERSGGSTAIRADTRIISATDKNLEDLTRSFQFRQDLYYRLNVFPIFVPPLRERKTDILQLANHFIKRASDKFGKSVSRISSSAIDMLMSYNWPGNIRELEGCIDQAVLLSTDGVIHAHLLPPSIQTAESTNTRHGGNLQVSLAALESELIVDALRSAGGNVACAAQALGITKKLMRLRITKYGIDPQSFQARGA